jgi:hypothetical protein
MEPERLIRGIAAVICALRRGALTPETRAFIPPEVLAHVEATIAGDPEARAVLAAWIERHGDRTTIQ